MSPDTGKTPPTEEKKDRGAQQAPTTSTTSRKRTTTGRFTSHKEDKDDNPGFLQRVFTNKVLGNAEKVSLWVSVLALGLFAVAKFGTSVGFLANAALFLMPFMTPIAVVAGGAGIIWSVTGAVMLNRKYSTMAVNQVESDITVRETTAAVAT